jgi:murein DD-endopeptidase MepM/ murein hydrolase activator NlpD
MIEGGSSNADGAWRAAAKGWLNHWFPDRQILIRGPERMSSVVLTQRQQVFGLTAAWMTLDATMASAKARTLAVTLESDQIMLRHVTAENAALLTERNQAVAGAVARITKLHDETVAESALAVDQAVAQQQLIAAANAAALRQLQAQTQSAIDQVEGIIKSTGLDPDRLVGEVAPPRRDPNDWINWSGISPDEQSRDDLLLNNVGRLQVLGSVLRQMPLASPVSFIAVSSPFGYRPNPWTGLREFHVGVDLRGPIGTPVYATAPGVVTYAGGETGYGLIVMIDHGFGFSTRYSHLDRIEVKVGEMVGLHQQIALLCSTGWSTGPHLLYETRVDGQPQNPMQFIKEADVQK